MKKASQLNNQQQVTCFAVLVVQNRFAPSAPVRTKKVRTKIVEPVLARGCSSQNRFYVNLNLWFGSVRFGAFRFGSKPISEPEPQLWIYLMKPCANR